MQLDERAAGTKMMVREDWRVSSRDGFWLPSAKYLWVLDKSIFRMVVRYFNPSSPVIFVEVPASSAV
jgi:hypothetical protein